jgi:hypothetical protein
MRKVAFRKAGKGRQVAQTTSVPAPVGGWNAKDSLANMDQMFAVETDNFFGQTTDVRVRKGWANHVTGIGQQVESLMPYNSQDGTTTMFGAANDSFYDFTATGAVGSPVVGSLSNARWQHVNFTNSAGNSYLCCFNGADTPMYWDGSSWIAITGASTPLISGITTTDILTAAVFKRRMYLVLNNSLSLYYLPIDSVGGTVARTRLDGYFNKGGYIIAADTWTLDAGEGSDDHLVVVSSEGQVAVFQGTNPSSSSSWALTGIWNLGEPIGTRCLMKYGGDLLILTVQGLFPLSKALQSSQVDPEVALTDKISRAFTEASDNYKSNYGWDIVFFPQGNQVIVNVPVVEGAGQEQYVMNTITNSWWRFTNVHSNCWCVCDGNLFFGGNGFVGQFGDSYSDNSEDIRTNMKQAFSYLGSKGRVKKINSLRPNLLANGIPTVSMGISIDFGDEQSQSTLSFSGTPAGTWDGSSWDSASWGGSVSPFYAWQTVSAVGTAISLRMTTVTNGIDVRHASTDYVYENGGVIV